MLDPTGGFRLAEVPAVDVYPDVDTPGRFYVVPTSPRVAREPDGRPQISLLLYGRRGVRAGGQLSVTVDLALSAAERKSLIQVLSRLVLPQGSTVTVLQPDWVGGEVEVRITPALHARGRPSLDAVNRASLTLPFGAGTVPAVRAAWNDGLPEATITYHGEVVAARTSRSRLYLQELDGAWEPGRTSSASREVHADMATTRGERHPLTILGPLTVSTAELRNAILDL